MFQDLGGMDPPGGERHLGPLVQVATGRHRKTKPFQEGEKVLSKWTQVGRLTVCLEEQEFCAIATKSVKEDVILDPDSESLECRVWPFCLSLRQPLAFPLV